MGGVSKVGGAVRSGLDVVSDIAFKINQEIESKKHDLHKEPPVFTQVETSKKGDEKKD